MLRETIIYKANLLKCKEAVDQESVKLRPDLILTKRRCGEQHGRFHDRKGDFFREGVDPRNHIGRAVTDKVTHGWWTHASGCPVFWNDACDCGAPLMSKIYQKCPVCEGHGYVTYPFGVAPGQVWSSTDCSNKQCHRCNGTGTVEKPCPLPRAY